MQCLKRAAEQAMQQFTLPAMAKQGRRAAAALLLASLACIIACSLVPVAEAQLENKWYASDVWMPMGQVIHVRKGDRGPLFGAYWQTDCNLVLAKGENVYWSTHTSERGSHTCYLAMQRDGNLVIYGDNSAPLWASNSPQPNLDDYYAEIQVDGNFVIYTPDGAPIWASNTVQ